MGSIKAWTREHKREIIITCGVVAVVAVGVTVFLIVNGKKVLVPNEIVKDVIAKVPKAPSLYEAADTAKATENTVMATFPRSEYIRHLPAGYHASPAKLAQAAEMGIELKPGETIVNETIVHFTHAA